MSSHGPDQFRAVAIDSSTAGAVLLGAPIGSSNFINEHLKNLVTTIRKTASQIVDFPDIQCRHLFFHHILKNKINYILRTTPPEFTNASFGEFESIMKKTLKSIIDTTVTTVAWKRAQLPISKGGFGLYLQPELPSIAYTASAFACIRDLADTFPEDLHRNWMLSESSIPWCDQVKIASEIAFRNMEKESPQVRLENFMKDTSHRILNQHAITSK